jgi:hypothetical protein
MGIKLTNNAFGTLASGINSSATSITLSSGQGARFPSLSAGDYFYATLIDTSNNLEIVKCTARSTDVLTVVRAQESTTARSYSTGDRIEIRLTAQTFLDASGVEDGEVTAAKLAAGAAVSNIGYTPVNKAGDTMTGTLTLTYGGVTRFSLPIGATDPNFTVNGDTDGVERRDIALRWQSNNSHGYVSVLRSDMGGTTFLNGYGSIRFNIGASNGSFVAGMTSSGFAVGLGGPDNTSYTGAFVATTNTQFHGRTRGPGFNVGNYTTNTWSDLGVGGETDGMFTRAEGQCYISVDDLFRIRDNTSSSTENKRFEFNTDTGSAGADANWNSNAFDFAEMFEWADGNPDNADRIGYSVALVPDTGKIKIAEAGDTPIGIVSGTAGFIGDSGFNCWSQMYMSDEWGRPLWDYLYNEDGTPQLNKYGEHAKTKRINPDYDPSVEYVQRRNRPEWATIGLLGKVFMRVGRPVNPNWIRLKPISESIELWLVR